MAETLKTATPEALQAELTRRHAEADADRRKQRTEDLAPILALGFGSDKPIGISMKELVTKLGELRRTWPDDINDAHRQAAHLGLLNIDSEVRNILPEEPAMSAPITPDTK